MHEDKEGEKYPKVAELPDYNSNPWIENYQNFYHPNFGVEGYNVFHLDVLKTWSKDVESVGSEKAMSNIFIEILDKMANPDLDNKENILNQVPADYIKEHGIDDWKQMAFKSL